MDRAGLMSRSIQLQHEFYDRLMESQYAAPEKRTAAQRVQLERLLRHARKHAPFYADRLDAMFGAGGEIDWDKWTSLPIVTRGDLQNHRDATLSRALPAGHEPAMDSATSGSTGAPITITDTLRARTMMMAMTMRAHTAHGLDRAGAFLFWLGDDPDKDAYPNADVGPPWGLPWEEDSTGWMMRLNRFTRQDELLRFIRDNDVPYLSCRPIAAQALALEAARDGGGSPLKAILGFSMGPRAEERADCLRWLGAKLIGFYGSKEGHNIAFECPTGPHLHINEEATMVEILDDDGRPSAPGEIGRVVITNLYNFAQPLIRYDHGDLAVWGAGACACGRTLPVIERIVGRTMNLFRFPDGTRVAPFMPTTLAPLLNARYVQLAQVKPLEVEVRYVPEEGKTGDQDAAEALVRRMTRPDVVIRFSARPDMVRIHGGKFMEVVCELGATA
jgi:phenylacetate-CoA ligase